MKTGDILEITQTTTFKDGKLPEVSDVKITVTPKPLPDTTSPSHHNPSSVRFKSSPSKS